MKLQKKLVNILTLFIHIKKGDFMKTRSNMPLFVVECSDVKALSNSQINQLRCGDYLVKKDASGEHAYKVTFKKEGVGMCLTYHDASVIETQSYDYVDGNWVYNSEDKTPNLLEVLTEEDIEGGTIDNAKPIYVHPINLNNSTTREKVGCLIFNNDPTPFTSTTFKQYIKALSIAVGGTCRIIATGGVFREVQEGLNIPVPTCYIFSTDGGTTQLALGGAGTIENFDAFIDSADVVLYDGVNKIN